MVQRGGAAVDKDPRPRHRRIIDFTHFRVIGADQVKVLARLQPRALDQRLRRHRRGADHIGGFHRRFQILGHAQTHRRGTRPRAAPDGKLRLRPQRAIGLDHRRRHRPRANQQKLARPLARQLARRQQTVARRLPLGHQMEIHQGRQLARHIVKQGHHPVHIRQAARLVARHHRRHLDQGPQPVDPGRPVQQHIGTAIQKQILDLGARQGMPRLQRRNQPAPIQQALGLFSYDFRLHRPASSAVSKPSATSRAAQPCQLSN